jgi:hypothetical protein
MIALATPVMAQGTIKAGEKPAVIIEPVLRDKDYRTAKPEPDVHFSTCREARAAGYSRMRTGQPGYARHLDRDNDGIACE